MLGGRTRVYLVSSLWMLALCGVAAAQSTNSPAKVIDVTARKYRFEPSPIRVRQGEPVQLRITAVDHDHGFQIKPLNINVLLKKGQPTLVKIPTDRPGTYTIHCSHFCGLGHHGMKATLVVEPT